LLLSQDTRLEVPLLNIDGSFLFRQTHVKIDLEERPRLAQKGTRSGINCVPRPPCKGFLSLDFEHEVVAFSPLAPAGQKRK
jgi:hypothetical protein